MPSPRQPIAPRGLENLRVYVADAPASQGLVVDDVGSSWVRVRWDEGDETWSRREFLVESGMSDSSQHKGTPASSLSSRAFPMLRCRP